MTFWCIMEKFWNFTKIFFIFSKKYVVCKFQCNNYAKTKDLLVLRVKMLLAVLVTQKMTELQLLQNIVSWRYFDLFWSHHNIFTSPKTLDHKVTCEQEWRVKEWGMER